MSNETNVQGEEKMSPEEIKKRRAEITKYYKEQIVHLKVQCEYEKLLTELEESRAKRLQAQAFVAQAYEAMNAPDEEEEDFNPQGDFENVMKKEMGKKRKLKTT
jgi:membrane-bound lytic murein transglycosylase|tara:strand:+ start:2494 stop:2805 length:312 start_codon:yes stop_codon:yes gene_type:complete